MTKRLMQTFKYWLPLAFATTAVSGLVYATVQQNYRQSANDPQIQMAEDAAALLSNGIDPKSLVAENKVEISKSLAPYIIIFDSQGVVLASSGQLDGRVPTPPRGVLQSATSKSENRVTWQPRDDVRGAAVVTRFEGTTSAGFVLASRSLREVEVRENRLTFTVAVAWVVTMLGSLLLIFFLSVF